MISLTAQQLRANPNATSGTTRFNRTVNLHNIACSLTPPVGGLTDRGITEFGAVGVSAFDGVTRS